MKYFCYYDTEINRRVCSLAAVNKINYICKKLRESGLNMNIVSCSMLADKKMPECTEIVSDGISVYFFPAWKRKKSYVGRVASTIYRNILLFFYMIRYVKKNETVIVYHSLANMRCIALAKWFKRFRLIMEVEEIYNDVYLISRLNAKREIRYIRSAEMYLFPTEVLSQKVNIGKKKQAIVYGAYEVQEFDEQKHDDGRIHIAYTGSFDPHKGGLMVALEIAKHLDDSFCLHILGTGSDEVLEKLNFAIKDNSSKNLCEIKYEGLKSGGEYNRYLQRCHLGLSTQNPDAAFNNTSFPSKVISYLSNNLRVLTAPLDVLTQSEFSDYLYYYYDNDPAQIAEVIKSIDFSDQYDSTRIIEELDQSFQRSLQELIKDDKI